MNLEEYALIAEIISAIAIVASLVFVGISIQQTNKLMEAQDRFNLLEVVSESASMAATNSQLADLIAADSDSSRPLSPGELLQLNTYYFRILSGQEWSFQELPEEDWEVNYWKIMAQRPGWIRHFNQRKPDLSPEFISYIEKNILNS